jgi:type I restriction enzyme S subunit
MAPGFPLLVNGIRIRTSEALYQACRFPHMPDIQRRIINETSPITAKMRIKPFRDQSRPDWDSVRVKIMRWCLRVKLAQNWRTFGELLLATGNRPIVEQSRKDDFWGAKVAENGKLVGMNVLGRLLMELREQLKANDTNSLRVIEPVEISEFLLLQVPIETVRATVEFPHSVKVEDRGSPPSVPPSQSELLQLSLFDIPTPLQGQMIHQNNYTDDKDKSEGLLPYPKYKNSDVSWIGKIPAHWSEKRAKYYFKEIDERSQSGDEEMLSVSHITGVTPRSQKNVTMFKAESNVGQKLCQPGDLVINTMWAWMAALGVSNYAGIVSPAYGVYRPKNDQDYDNYYLDHLLRIEGYRSEYICRSTGIRSSRLRLYPDKFLSMRIVCPPQEEQRTIARFLKAQDLLFRKFIRNKRRLIELLKEQKQNIINQAVTRGLDPNVKFKPSGVEWIGDIPEHWEARRLRTLAAVRASGVDKNTNEGEASVMLCNYVDVYKNDRITANINFMKATATPEEIRSFELKPGDVIITKDSESWDDIAIPTFVPEVLPGVVCAYHLALIRPFSGEIEGEFLFRTFSSDPVADQFRIAATGVTRFGLAQGAIKGAFFPLPPLKEQRAIIAHINEKCAEISQAISRGEREIELMLEYRTRLISDVVTGKVNVRGIEVPEVAEKDLLELDEDTAETDDVINDDEGGMDETD